MARKYSVFRYALIALLVYHAVTAARIAPNYVAFANDFWGGPNNTYVARNGIKDCWYAYHGLLELTEALQPCRLPPGTFPYHGSDQVKHPVPLVIEGTVILTAMTFPPRDPRMHLTLGLAYAAARRNDEAKREFEEAIQDVQGNPLFRNVELRAQREPSRLNSN